MMSSYPFKKLEDLGAVKEVMKEILSNEIFDDLSKHSTYWQSEHVKEDEKLHDIRLRLSCHQERLYDLQEILYRNEENDDVTHWMPLPQSPK